MRGIRGSLFGVAAYCSVSLRGVIGAVFLVYFGAGAWLTDSWSYVAAATDGDHGCPREALREMMASAANYSDVGDVAALELEVLRLCNERQKLIVQVVEGETRLAELRGVKRTGDGAPAPENVMLGLAEDLPSPAKAPLRPGTSDFRESSSTALLVEPGTLRDSSDHERSPQELRWTTVYGSAGNWVAGISDGSRVWYLSVGDELPSGVRVEMIRERPPGVQVGLNGKKWQIPGPGTPGVVGKDARRVDSGRR